jgi:uncharacterized RDD family membrane protein YckC
MEYEDRVTISTPEGVEVQLTLAGIGSRMMAGIVDLAIQTAIWVALSLLVVVATGGSGWGAAVLAVVAFLLVFGYDVGFEVLAAGRTPGKRLTGLRVVRTGGGPVDLVTSAIRNVLRILDFMPGFYALGMVSVLFTQRNQRIGDLAAGTLVVRERLGGRRSAPARPGGFLPPAPGMAASWDVSAVSAQDIATVRSFLARRAELDPAAAGTLASELATRLRPRVAGAPDAIPAERFLELLSAAKAARE